MRWLEWLLGIAGAALLALGVFRVTQSRRATYDLVIINVPGCSPTPFRVLPPPSPPAQGAIVVFHGLGGNRLVMLTLGQRLAAAGFKVYLMDFAGHGDNTSPFWFNRVESCTAAMLQELERRKEITANRTVLLGHSMGAGVAVRMADHFSAAGTIAISPAPLVLPRKMPANLLVVSPRFDLPQVKEMAARLAAAEAGDPRESAQDFFLRQAFRVLRVPERSHTSVIFDPEATRAMAEWSAAAVGESLPGSYQVDTRALSGGLMGMAGLYCLFPLLASAFAWAFKTKPDDAQVSEPRSFTVVLLYISSALAATFLLAFWVPLRFLRIYSADYLVSLLLLISLPVLLLQSRHLRGQMGAQLRPLLLGGTLAFMTILLFGGWMTVQLAGAWPNAARWARFPFLAAALAPYCVAEEIALGSPAARRFGRRLGRFGLFVLLRLLVWGACVYAVYVGWSDAILLVVFLAYMAAFSISQRLGADAVRRRTGSAAAAALFSAILGAWFLAAVYPLT